MVTDYREAVGGAMDPAEGVAPAALAERSRIAVTTVAMQKPAVKESQRIDRRCTSAL